MKKYKFLIVVLAIPFIGSSENSKRGSKDCNAYASSMMAAIETYYGCLESDNYNEAYIGFRDFCRLASAGE